MEPTHRKPGNERPDIALRVEKLVLAFVEATSNPMPQILDEVRQIDAIPGVASKQARDLSLKVGMPINRNELRKDRLRIMIGELALDICLKLFKVLFEQ